MRQRVPKSNDQKPSIGFLLDDGLDSPDGVQQYILTVGEELTRLGYSVHYIVGETKRTDIPNIHALAKNIRVSFNGNTLTIPLPVSKKAIRATLAEINLDVLHVQMPYSPFYGAKVIGEASSSTVVVGTFHIYPYSFLSRMGTRLLGLMLVRSLRRFDAVVSVSHAAQHFARTAFSIDSAVVPNVVNVEKYRPHRKLTPNKKLRIVYVGRLVERKGCQLLLRALHESDTDKSNIEVIICGRGALQETLQDYVLKNNMSSYVQFTGFVTEEEKIDYLQSADIAMFPSYAGESFGIVLIEAMAAQAGCVVGGDNPGYRSVLTNIEESLVDVTDSVIFSDYITRLIADHKLRQTIHMKQQQLVKQYDVRSITKELLTIYENCKKT